MPGRETTTTIARDDGTRVIVTTTWDGWLDATYEDGSQVGLGKLEIDRAWASLKLEREDDDGSDALFEARRDGRAA